MTRGYIKIEHPFQLERAITRTINKILAREDCVENAGKIASLANAWINCRRLRLDNEEIIKIEERLSKLESESGTNK
jgi:hypothetical protein